MQLHICNKIPFSWSGLYQSQEQIYYTAKVISNELAYGIF
jgi:hypothetical protein